MKKILTYKLLSMIFMGIVAMNNLHASTAGAGAGAGVGSALGAPEGAASGTTAMGAVHPAPTATVYPALTDYPTGPVQEYRTVLMGRDNTHILTDLEMFHDIERLQRLSTNDAHFGYLQSFYVGLKTFLINDIMFDFPDPARGDFYFALYSTLISGAAAIWKTMAWSTDSSEADAAAAAWATTILAGRATYKAHKELKGSLRLIDCGTNLCGRRYTKVLRKLPIDVMKGKMHEVSIAAALKYQEDIDRDFDISTEEIKSFIKFIQQSLLTESHYATSNFSLIIIEKMREIGNLSG